MSAVAIDEGSGSAAPGPTLLGETEAEQLATRIQAHAAHVAEAECRLLLLIGEFDAGEGTRWYVGVKSIAHWLSWACSMAPGPAREHVRVARALREMPLTVREFSAGRLSYSKVREMSRVVGLVDEQELLDLARAMTASQLARTVSTFRALEGTRMSQDARREASWRVREDGMIELRVLLPAEMGAEIITALDLAMERDESAVDEIEGTVPPADPTDPTDPTPPGPPFKPAPLVEQRRADAVVDLARAYLDADPADRSGEDRHLVLLHATPDMLVEADSPVQPEIGDLTDQGLDDVPAGTSIGSGPHRTGLDPMGRHDRAGILGMGPVEARTVQRLACTGLLALLVTDDSGEVLHLGRAKRLASRAQRRALRATQQVCQFPGCHQSRHLDAHHIVPWGRGGATDIGNLALLCRRHHVLVHEGGLHLRRVDSGRTSARGSASGERAGAESMRGTTGPGTRLEVVDARGVPVQAQWPPTLETVLVAPLSVDDSSDVDSNVEEPGAPQALWGEGDARIAPTTGGFGFTLEGTVTALCQSPTRGHDPEDGAVPGRAAGDPEIELRDDGVMRDDEAM